MMIRDQIYPIASYCSSALDREPHTAVSVLYPPEKEQVEILEKEIKASALLELSVWNDAGE